MRALNSRFVLIDINSPWHFANQVPISALNYIQNANFITSISSSFRQTRGARKTFASPKPSPPSIHPPTVRRPGVRGPSRNGSVLDSPNSASTSRSGVDSELELLLELLPLRMRKELCVHRELGDLIEVVMDLGRKPLARFPSGDCVISEQIVRHEDLKHAIAKVGDFSDDNRSGIDRSLHRISAIRNRKMQVIGLTCRVGRAVAGSAEIIHDLVEGGGSILVIGPPGVGKTTLIREIARMLADDHMKRVVIVDTSNEIGGDGDVPHSGIGRARRMQVPNVNMQHNVMIEAVENHMPEAIIIDEIGTELEALAASTIAQRGVQLVGTAHGMTIDSIIKNPSLQILVGGIESVTLGDEEAKKRKVQKTILERKGPPTFTCAVELISRTECRVHHRLDATVDDILAGKSPLFEVRQMDVEHHEPLQSSPIPRGSSQKDSELIINEDKSAEMESDEEDEKYVSNRFKKHSIKNQMDAEHPEPLQSTPIPREGYREDSELPINKDKSAEMEYDEEDEEYASYRFKKNRIKRSVRKPSSPVCVYTHKILEADLLQVAKVMGLEDEIDVTDDIGTADAILASSCELKQNPWIRGVAKFHQLPIFVIKSNTMAKMVKAVRMILGMESFGSIPKLSPKSSSFDIEIEDDAPKRKPTIEEIDALEEVRLAIEYIVIPGGEAVELLPRRSEIVARQLELVESYQLAAETSGTELNSRLQILPLRINQKSSSKSSKSGSTSPKETPGISLTGSDAGTSVTRLPFLPE